ncbi:class I adenylate-forming enzyme family protein [Lutimaribacter marinistellae]|uniref:Class I adenylate-forming enzyme family protein n=1 Tax=Lutimaribacter marinistellae TaxID=1820329 RepID=A0ABV7TFE6_9RHOB
MTDTVDDPQVYLPDLFATHARFHPGKEAVICGPVRRTWGDFDANISRIAHGLIAGGLQKGDKVALLMGNSVEMLESLFGIVRAGGVAVPLSGMLTADQLKGLLSDCDATRAFVSAEFQDKVDANRGAIANVSPSGWIAHGFDGDGWTTLPDLISGQPATVPNVRYQLTDEFNIIYSSGTTGLPKGIVQTHRARLHWAFSNAVEMGFTSTSRALTTTALYSNGTWLMMLPVLFAGGTLVAMEAFDVAEFLRLVPQEGITHTFMVPAQYGMVLDHPDLAGADLSSLRTLLSAGSSLRRDMKARIIEQISPGLYELYGYSEGFASMLKPHQHADKFATVGTPVLGFEVRILDDDGNECPPGTPGEIAGYGAGIMKCYHKRPDATAELIWRDERGRTFLRSGDIGMIDEDGFLCIVDRKKDMIISGGFNVFPTDVEAVVAQHADVFDVTVIGVPHDKWGESCLALVIPRDATAIDCDALRDWANERLAKTQRLVAVELREEFPRNALGKVMKRLLRDPYWAEQDAAQ